MGERVNGMIYLTGGMTAYQKETLIAISSQQTLTPYHCINLPGIPPGLVGHLDFGNCRPFTRPEPSLPSHHSIYADFALSDTVTPIVSRFTCTYFPSWALSLRYPTKPMFEYFASRGMRTKYARRFAHASGHYHAIDA